MASAISCESDNETRELARQTAITFLQRVVWSFPLAFSEWSGFDDLVVGTPVANRTRQTARETMDITRACTAARADRLLAHCRDHLRAGHQQTIDSFANAIPFVELARALGQQSEAGYDPVSRFALLCRTIPCRRFRCLIFPHA